MTSKIITLMYENPANWEEIILNKKIEIKKQNDLCLFKYKMDADFHDPIVREARGIIIDTCMMEVIAWPFDKFGNYGETYVEPIDWSSARVQEKMDGSIMKLYFYEGKWNLATNGTIDASQSKNYSGRTFASIFAEAENISDLDYKKLNPSRTYIFELISPYNKIVVQYDKTMIYHIGTRDNQTGMEYNEDIGVIKPKEYALYSLEDCIEFVNTFSAKEHEGFVCVDKNWKRIKVKSPDYLKAHYLANNSILTLNKAIDLICDNETEEYLTYFPEQKEIIDKIEKIMKNTISDITTYCSEIKEKKLDRKTFGMLYNKDKYFKFAIDVVYLDKELKVDKKFWKKFLSLDNL